LKLGDLWGKVLLRSRLTRGSPLCEQGQGRGKLEREEKDVEDSSVSATRQSDLAPLNSLCNWWRKTSHRYD